jgi:type I restriction enzyme, S subunit
MSSKKRPTGMKEEDGPALVPKLQFPEFRAAAWEKKLIGPYLEDCSGRVPSDTQLPIYSSTREGVKRQDAYFDGRVLQNENEYGMVPPGCFVYRHMSDDGVFKFNINETGGEIAVSKEYPVFRTKSLNSAFLLAALNDGLDFKRFALSQKAGGTRTRLYFSKLREWRTLLPSPAEQQKIAACLSSVDELIAAQARKVDALKAHKKGLMQQLFPREGEARPRLRFLEFRNDGEWDAKRLDELVDIQSGATPSKANPAFWKGSIPWVSAKDMKRLFLEGAEDHISAEAVDDGARVVPPGTLLVLTRGMTLLKDVPVCLVRREMSFNQDVKGLRPKGGVDGLFLAWMLTSNKQRLLAMVDIAGHGTGKLDTDALKALELMLPPPPEQHRIAACLSALEDLITLESQNLEALKTHKKGLMQQLFPSPEAAAA